MIDPSGFFVFEKPLIANWCLISATVILSQIASSTRSSFVFIFLLKSGGFVSSFLFRFIIDGGGAGGLAFGSGICFFYSLWFNFLVFNFFIFNFFIFNLFIFIFSNLTDGGGAGALDFTAVGFCFFTVSL